MTKILAAMLMLVSLSASSGSQATDLTGDWQISIVHGHDHAVPHGLELKHTNDQVTAILHTPHNGKLTLEGTFADGTLKLSSAADGGDHAMTLSGTLKNDGTLEGVVDGRMGRLQWKAERFRTPYAQ
jgi:hypothetical protein